MPGFRISPLWWPVITGAAPFLIPSLMFKNRKFKVNQAAAERFNRDRMAQAGPLDLPELERLDLTVLQDDCPGQGYQGAPGVCYLIETDRGSLVFDLGFGDDDPSLAHNTQKIAPDLARADAVVISHLHPDHMGGFQAYKHKKITLPRGFGALKGKPCFVPDPAVSGDMNVRIVRDPVQLPAGMASTGPLARALFFMGLTLEQMLVARVRGKGVVVITGCGHPTIEAILALVRELLDEPVHAVVGGLHLPVTDSPLKRAGIKAQMIWGTGKPPWQRINDRDVDQAVQALNQARAARVYLSTHDICAYSVSRLERGVKGRVTCLKAGERYCI